MSVSPVQPADCRDSRAFSAGFRYFHKGKYKWWSIIDDILSHFLKSLPNSVTSSWITRGTFHNAKSSRHNYRILCNGTETIRWRFSWGVGLLQVQWIKSHLFRSEGLVQDVVPSVSFILSYSNISLVKGRKEERGLSACLWWAKGRHACGEEVEDILWKFGDVNKHCYLRKPLHLLSHDFFHSLFYFF